MINGKPMGWSLIQLEVTEIVKEIGDRRFINARRIVEHIDKNQEKYPGITRVNAYHPETKVTTRTISTRVNIAIKQMGWTPWNRNGSGRTGRVYIVPWVPSDFTEPEEEGRAVTG